MNTKLHNTINNYETNSNKSNESDSSRTSEVLVNQDDPWRVIRTTVDNDGDREAAADIAEYLLDRHDFVTREEDERLFLYDNDVGVYCSGGERRLREIISQGLTPRYYSDRIVTATIEKIKPTCYRPADDLGNTPGIVGVENGVIDLSDPNNPELKEHRPDYHLLSTLPVTFDPSAECPAFEEFIEGVVSNKHDRQRLQEYVGYCLHHWGLPFPRSLLLIGPTAGGKSTFLNVVNRALGEENVSNQSLQGLVNDRFGKAAIFGKMANIDNDLSSKAVAEEGTFKKLTAGDRLMIEEKNQQPFDIRVTQKQIYSANRVPKVTNPDDAFFRRWIHVQFPDTVPESERDRHLEHRLTTEEELSGVLNWMLEGYARLMDQDSFTGERSIDEKRSLWKAHGDSLDRFIESEVIKDSAAQSAKDAVYAEYKQFCDTQGFPVKKKQTLSKRLKQAIDIETSKPSVDGEQVPHYRGMRLKNNAGLFE